MAPRPLSFLVVVAALALACGGATTSSHRLVGRVVAADGGAPRLAHLHLDTDDGELIVEVEADGTFSLDLPAGDFHRLRVSAVDHEELEVPVVIPAGTPDPVELTVALAGNPWKPTFEAVSAVGSWGDDRRPLTRREDGTWTLVVETEEPELRYELAGVAANGNTVNGPQADRFEYDRGGDYYSVLTVRGGRVEIVFDPARLPPPGEGPRPTVSSPLAILEQAFALASGVEAAEAARRDALRSGGTVDLVANYAAAKQELALPLADAATEPALRRFVATEMLRLPGESRGELEKTAIALLPASSPLWARVPWALAELDATEHGPLLEAIAARSGSPEARAAALYSLAAAAKAGGDEAAWRERYRQLVEGDLADTRFARFARDALDPATPVALGRSLPAFELTLDDGTRITPASLAGTVTLIDFWATWCLPCIAEMPQLHEARRRYPESRLRLVSISFDAAASDVAPFRAARWPMPWLHAFAEGGMDSEVAEVFNVHGIPKPVLAGVDGTILAIGDELRGDELLTVLERVLGPGEPAGS